MSKNYYEKENVEEVVETPEDFVPAELENPDEVVLQTVPDADPIPAAQVTVVLDEIKEGCIGSQVRTVQRICKTYTDATLDISGIWDRKTTKAFKHLQQYLGLTEDGICGQESWTAILTKM